MRHVLVNSARNSNSSPVSSFGLTWAIRWSMRKKNERADFRHNGHGIERRNEMFERTIMDAEDSPHTIVQSPVHMYRRCAAARRIYRLMATDRLVRQR